MKKYMFKSEMLSLTQLRGDGKRSYENNTYKSQISLAFDPRGKEVEHKTPRKKEGEGFGKLSGYQTERCKKPVNTAFKSQMDDILSYRDAPKYREMYSASKITSEDAREVTKQTLQHIIKNKMEGKDD